MKKLINYFTKTEIILWVLSVFTIITSFIIFDRKQFFTLITSLIGVTSLILNAKGNPIGQILMIIFSIFYGIISFSFKYYGEMITYLGLTLPMAIIAFISWIRNPYDKSSPTVKVNKLKLKEIIFMFILSLIVTVIFYFILKYFNTANIIPSTISVTTSFIAVYLTFRRSAYYAIGYALNDIVLIVLWTLASLTSLSYICVVICFVVFLVNDIYGFINWKHLQKIQQCP